MTIKRLGDSVGFQTGELLPPLHNHIAVQRVEFHQERTASGLLGGDHGRAAAAEEVEA